MLFIFYPNRAQLGPTLMPPANHMINLWVRLTVFDDSPVHDGIWMLLCFLVGDVANERRPLSVCMCVCMWLIEITTTAKKRLHQWTTRLITNGSCLVTMRFSSNFYVWLFFFSVYIPCKAGMLSGVNGEHGSAMQLNCVTSQIKHTHKPSKNWAKIRRAVSISANERRAARSQKNR